jgi:hypothetical protein
LVNTVCSHLRSTALSVTLYEQSRTAHSMFGILVNKVSFIVFDLDIKSLNLQNHSQFNTNLILTIGSFSHRADLIRNASLIVWKELAAANVAAFHSCNELCCRIMQNEKPMGGILFIGLEDFRQVAPVVPDQGVVPALQASIKLSYL